MPPAKHLRSRKSHWRHIKPQLEAIWSGFLRPNMPLETANKKLFPREFSVPGRKTCKTARKFFNLVHRHNGSENIFTNTYSFVRYYKGVRIGSRKQLYPDLIPQRKTVIIDRLYFDFDTEDPEKLIDVKEEVLQFTKFWLRHRTQPTIFFSGSKGFSVNVFFSPVLLKTTGAVRSNHCAGVDAFIDWIREENKFKFLDPNRLGDLVGVQRLPYTIHPKTRLWCFPVTLRELAGDMGKILKLAKSPPLRRIKKVSSEWLQEKLIEFDEKALEDLELEREYQRVRAKDEDLVSRQIRWLEEAERKDKIRPCFLHGLEVGVDPGKRNSFFFALAAELGTKDFTEDEKIKIIALCVEKSGLEPDRDFILSEIERAEGYVSEGKHWTKKRLVWLKICYQEKRPIGCIRCTKEYERLGGYQE